MAAEESDDWIKNQETGEVKWFDGVGKEAESKAEEHWRTSPTEKPKVENLGSSFFGTRSNNAVDNFQMNTERESYLLESAKKLGKEAGFSEGDYFNNATLITYDFLKENFMGIGKSDSKSGGITGEIMQLVWDYGGADYTKNKLPKNILTSTIFRGLDLYLSSENLNIGSDKTSGFKTNSAREFRTKMPNVLTKSTMMSIMLHKF